jgi:hypothetical protein
LLTGRDLTGKVITLDALHTLRATAKQIRKQNGQLSDDRQEKPSHPLRVFGVALHAAATPSRSRGLGYSRTEE